MCCPVLADVRLCQAASHYEPANHALRRTGINEQRPLDFHSPYGCSKGAADQYVKDYARMFGLPEVVFRMSWIYGPHQCGTEAQGWATHILLRALAGESITLYGDGLQVRVRLEGCGVCASNLPLWQGRPWFTYPLAPGVPVMKAGGILMPWAQRCRASAVATASPCGRHMPAPSTISPRLTPSWRCQQPWTVSRFLASRSAAPLTSFNAATFSATNV